MYDTQLNLNPRSTVANLTFNLKSAL